MISIIKALNEGVFSTLNDKLVNSKFGKAVDNINNKIDSKLQKSALGRIHMKIEDTVGDAARQGVNNLANLKDQLLKRNFKIRR